MKREVLIFYLREIRDLEFAKWRIKEICKTEEQKIKKSYKELTSKKALAVPGNNVWTTGKKVVFTFGILLCLISIICLFCPISDPGPSQTTYKNGTLYVPAPTYVPIYSTGLGIIMIICILVFGGIAWFIWKCANDEKKIIENEIRQIEEYNENLFVELTISQEKHNKLKADWKEKSLYFKSELNKVNKILEDFYNINIVPKQYRNFESIIYIYDYMSTADASLEQALLHGHLEDGFKRILDKLDFVIKQNSELILSNRRIEALDTLILDKNIKMLKELEKIERNTSVAAQYAEITANYTEANAYFNMANYLKR